MIVDLIIFKCSCVQSSNKLVCQQTACMHAAYRLAKRYVPVLPTIGSVLVNRVRGNDAQYYVVSIVHHTTYASLLRVQS